LTGWASLGWAVPVRPDLGEASPHRPDNPPSRAPIVEPTASSTRPPARRARPPSSATRPMLAEQLVARLEGAANTSPEGRGGSIGLAGRYRAGGGGGAPPGDTGMGPARVAERRGRADRRPLPPGGRAAQCLYIIVRCPGCTSNRPTDRRPFGARADDAGMALTRTGLPTSTPASSACRL